MYNVYVYILVMAIVTYLIRVVPLALIRKEIKSPFIKSFLFYVPYATLAAMTFPSILMTQGLSLAAGIAGLVTALVLSYLRKNLLTVAACACGAALVIEVLINVL
ncbi:MULTISPECIES: AzlD domain-containing protein [Butyrivibrio]|jgi:branched-subunit amino acid transport protein|uniref:AzlD domain-containing protein n=1 Tax=Butyrivibrio fibrisolvens TaxID=831 RepID=A0A1H9PHK5_BUTFI|nr:MULTISPECIES: AzlD domain-containing protein [Butyrivibrio]MBQ1457697.1 AzlD domain-containing protein [Butyrivibrio sp.]PWT27438.1 AzlD domain-containing protein [Butyrivibrio fibrisolvens]SEQ47728.1 Branched-chain amino acid transport protein [Butyrivibrio sp. TB]SER47658.1 Branched-chain amino acid transport protein [Butyrivibrio fibrisolvens]